MTDKEFSSSFFIASKAEKKKKTLIEHNLKSLIVFLGSILYGLFIYFIILLQLRGQDNLSMFALYSYGLIGGFAVLFLNRFYTKADRSRKILTEVLEKSAEARIITNPNGETIYSNLRFDKIIKDKKNASLEGFCKIFKEPEKIENELKHLSIKASPAGSATKEFYTNMPDNNLWFQVTCQHIVGWNGYIHWRFDDITPRHQMEAVVREEREKLRDFTDNAPVGFFSVNEKGKFIFANDMFLNLLGTDSNTLIGNASLHDFLVSPPQESNPYDCFNSGGYHQHGELLVKGAGSRIFKAAVTHSITKTSDNKIISRSIIYDLTAEQKIQQALLESEDRFQKLFEEAPVGICMLNEKLMIIDTNQSLSLMLNLPRDVINGKKLITYIEDESQLLVENWLKKLFREEVADPFIEVPIKGKKEIIAQIYARKFKKDKNIFLHFIDLTERKKLETQFAQSQKMQAVGQLAGGIAHDFNNLLTAMIGFADLLLLRHQPGDPSFSDIMQIKQNANRAANMVRQLLAFSRQQTLQSRVLNPTDILTELSHLIRRLIGVNIELNISHSSNQGNIKADQGQMEQVIINLAVNSRDAMPEGGILTIDSGSLTTYEDIKLGGEDILPMGEWVTISVKDTGTGISSDVISRIFEPFFSTKPVGSGTGLGLATVHGIIHQTGGYISVESKIGEGTSFTLYLPHYKENANDILIAKTELNKAEEEKETITDLTGSSKILLVEDEDAVRIFSSRALSNKGYEVFDASGGVAALNIIKEKSMKPDLLITDVMMPEMDGTTLAKKVREIYPDMKIIFMSGYAEDKFKEHVGGNAYFLPKPFTLKKLATKVKEVIEDKKTE